MPQPDRQSCGQLPRPDCRPECDITVITHRHTCCRCLCCCRSATRCRQSHQPQPPHSTRQLQLLQRSHHLLRHCQLPQLPCSSPGAVNSLYNQRLLLLLLLFLQLPRLLLVWWLLLLLWSHYSV